MNTYIQSTVNTFQRDLIAKCEVYNTLRDMIDVVEAHTLEVQHAHISAKHKLSEQLNTVLISRINFLEDANSQKASELTKIRQYAKTVREKFVNDILFFLSENRTNQRLKERIAELESLIPEGGVDTAKLNKEKTDDASEDVSAVAAPDSGSASSEKSPAVSDAPVATTEAPTPVAQSIVPIIPAKVWKKVYAPLALDLEDKVLLIMFAFLKTGEVLQFAQICRYMYQRVDTIFGIQYPLIQPSWRERKNVRLLVENAPTSTENTATSASTGPEATAVATVVAVKSTLDASTEQSAQADFRITRELIEPILKKLTAQENRVVVGLAERVKKLQVACDTEKRENESLVEEKERTQTELFFFMNKLQECESVLLEFMQKEKTLRQQAASDNEVISYLDGRVQELEFSLQEQTQRSQGLQAALDLQLGTHSVREEQLSAALADIQTKFDTLDERFTKERKLLAREVKTLRTKVESLSLEKAQLASKLQSLRSALALEDTPISSTKQQTHQQQTGRNSGANSGANSLNHYPQTSTSGVRKSQQQSNGSNNNSNHGGAFEGNGADLDLSELVARMSKQPGQTQQTEEAPESSVSGGNRKEGRSRGDRSGYGGSSSHNSSASSAAGVNQFW